MYGSRMERLSCVVDEWDSFDSYFNLPLQDHHYNPSGRSYGKPIDIAHL